MTIEDAVATVKDLLSSNWNSSNTDNITPMIEAIYDVKRVSGLTAQTDAVLIYEGKTVSRFNALGWLSRIRTTPISIDIRGSYSRSRTLKMLKEVDRIIRANLKSPGTGYDLVEPLGWIDLSDRTKKLWRWVYDVNLIVKSEVI